MIDLGLGMIASGLISGAASLFGGKQANKANAAQAAAANAASAQAQQTSIDFNEAEGIRNRVYNAEQAIHARDWSERMSNTAYQRATQDMRAAGINPILAYQQGGASTPSASMASGSAQSVGGFTGQQAHMENVLGPAVSNAMAAAEAFGGLQQIQANIANTEADTIKKAAETRNHDATTGLRTLEAINTKGVIPENISSQTRRNIADAALRNVQTGRGAAELEDYRNYGPPNPTRDLAISGARSIGTVGSRAGNSVTLNPGRPMPEPPREGGGSGWSNIFNIPGWFQWNRRTQ